MEQNVKNYATELRKQGKTYSEILNLLDVKISKSTLSSWLTSIKLEENSRNIIRDKISASLVLARNKALKIKRVNRCEYLKSVLNKNLYLKKFLDNQDIAKLIISALYLGEGTKDIKRSALVFANSNPNIIVLFLKLLRFCYKIDENRFRCTLQCRADQKTNELESFWSDITKIPKTQFYKALIDKRTIGKVSKNLEYKGVCRIDYFSSEVFIDILKIIEVIT
ncbi:MAG: hypothetical protein AAB657_03450 [Patescibacteria group bacterium]